MSQKDDKLKEEIHRLAADFFSRESNRKSMITVTDVEITGKGGKAAILISVLPESAEEAALDFASRQIMEFKQFVEDHSRIARIPFFEVRIDAGEKNRQRIEDISSGQI
ncbi:MAG: hypothetical protein KGI66_03780 [Patescibacteria group bacterium]|nr:hypothetical protein [Patescibacteria group bacterium]